VDFFFAVDFFLAVDFFAVDFFLAVDFLAADFLFAVDFFLAAGMVTSSPSSRRLGSCGPEAGPVQGSQS
jgi:hypothetical protein